MKKKLLYITGSRAEYGIMKRLLAALYKDNEVNLKIVVTGMHCEASCGFTYKEIINDGFVIDRYFPLNIDTANNSKILNSMSKCQAAFGEYFQNEIFDAVMILGDRYEIFSATIAAAFHNIPIIHFHGGEKTLGNYDEFIRHSITKMSKLHLASTEEYKNRIIQLGENPDYTFNIGALGAENSVIMTLPTKNELEIKFDSLDRAYFIVVFHPETLSAISVEKQSEQLLLAIKRLVDQYDFIFIGSNSDTGADIIKSQISQFCQEHKLRFIVNARPEEYLALNKYSNGLIGNSSSGLIEIPSLNIPTVNIGDRQKGRVRGKTVIDCKCNEMEIYDAIIYSQTEKVKDIVKYSINPYYSKNVMQNAISIVKKFINDPNIKNVKDFYDLNNKK